MSGNKRYLYQLIFLATLFIIIFYIFRSVDIKRLIGNPVFFFETIYDSSELSTISFNAIFLSTAVFILAALIDLIFLGWNKSALKSILVLKDKSTIHDFWCWLLLTFGIFDFFLLVLSFGIFFIVSAQIQNKVHFHLLRQIPWPWLQLVVLSLAFDFKTYVWHRFMHTKPFWELHKFHHSATNFSLLTSHRVHFLEKGIFNVFNAVLFSLIGAPLHYFLGWGLFVSFYNHLLHSNVNWSLGVFGRYVFISPRAHKIHHTSDGTIFNKNFGAMFNFWDKIFGTFLDTDKPTEIGVENNPYNKNSLLADMASGIKLFGLSLYSMLKNSGTGTRGSND